MVRPSFVSFLRQWVRAQKLISCWKNILRGGEILTICMAARRIPSILQQLLFHQCVLGEHASMPRIFLQFYTAPEHDFVTSLLGMLDIHSFSENSCAPLSASALFNTGLIESHCTAASVCRSYWSKWRSSFVNIFEMAVERVLHVFVGQAEMILHYLPNAGMVPLWNTWSRSKSDRVWSQSLDASTVPSSSLDRVSVTSQGWGTHLVQKAILPSGYQHRRRR